MAQCREGAKVSPAVAAGCWARFAAAALAAALSGLAASTGPQLRVLPKAMNPVMSRGTPWPNSRHEHRDNAVTGLLGGSKAVNTPALLVPACLELPPLGGSELSRERRLVDTGLRFCPGLGPGLLSADFAPAVIHVPAQPQNAMACLKQGRPAFPSQAKIAHAWQGHEPELALSYGSRKRGLCYH